MRALIVATIIAASVQPGYAQRPAINLWGEKEKDPGLEQYRKQQEEEYNATLKKIPNKEKKSSDPWQTLRGAAPAKKTN